MAMSAPDWMIPMGAIMMLFWGGIVVGIAWLIRGTARGWLAHEENAVTREDPVESSSDASRRGDLAGGLFGPPEDSG
jgi:hypothetical protein